MSRNMLKLWEKSGFQQNGMVLFLEATLRNENIIIT